VPVPNDENQTMYVWCDALANYISALGYGDNNISKNPICHSREGGNPLLPQSINPANNSDKFQKYWPADIHLIGKDILRFHAAIWPAMLLSAKLPLPKKIFVHGFVTSDGQKMSKSIGNVIDPFAVIEKYKSVDALRYYLLKEIPSSGDGDFSYERFEEVYQADLANGLGNLVARVLAMAKKSIFNFQFSIFKQSRIFNFQTITNKTWEKYENGLSNFKLNETLEVVRKFMSICDEYIEKNKPWQIENKEEKAIIVYNLLESLRHIAWMIRPFMPETSDKIFMQLFTDEKERSIELSKTLSKAQKWGGLKAGTKIKKGESLFPRLMTSE
jgi:methionyl-tRNA synthetase